MTKSNVAPRSAHTKPSGTLAFLTHFVSVFPHSKIPSTPTAHPMNCSIRAAAMSVFRRASTLAIACFFSIASVTFAQGPAPGTIEGRVLNGRSGEYLENARVTIEGTSLEAFTDSGGDYRITNVPAGTARVRVFFTGLEVQTDALNVSAGKVVRRDFTLEAFQQTGAGRDASVVKLSQYVVAASKEMEGAAIAINEQRFAANIRTVVSADEFGSITDGNVSEFLKFLPGVALNSVGGEGRTIMLNGVPNDYVPVTLGGFNVASAAGSSTSRRLEFDQISLNNISRLEVLQSPTPESPGSALAGSINMVPRGAFDRARPALNANVYVMMKDNERTLRKTPGPMQDAMHHVVPGFDFSWIVPVNQRFGFTLTGGNSTLITPLEYVSNIWRGVASGTSTPAGSNPGAFPDTPIGQPYLSEFQVRMGGKISRRSSAGVTVDYKVARNDRVSLGFQYAFSDKPFAYRYLIFQPNRVLPGNFTPTFTRGDVGAGEVRISNQYRKKTGTTYTPTLVWRHDGPLWKMEAGAGFSHSTNIYSDIDKGFFGNSLARRSGVTISFDDIFYLRPRRITVTDTAGRPVDPFDIRSYALNTANGDMRTTLDVQRSAFANMKRDFDARGVPLSLKAGLDVRNTMRDNRGSTPPFTFVGADRRATTTPVDPLGSDDGAAVALDVVNSQRNAPFGFPRIQWVDNYKYWDLYTARPDYFTIDRNSEYRSGVSNSKVAEETISSAYLRGDIAFMERRLRLVGGLRAEQTNVKAEGPLTDPTRNFQRDASGRPILGANGRPLPIVATTNALGVSQLTFIDRGMHAKKEYLRLFPSLNASYNVRENLIARAAFYTSVGRPDYNQYAGGLTLPDTELAPSTSNVISVNNVAIKAWSAKTEKVRFEYYFERVGQISVGAFQRDFKNFFGSTRLEATPEFLALYGLDPNIYDPYQVATQYNVTNTVRMRGLEFDYKQALTFLPHWARGAQIFANAAAVRATGNATGNFTGFVPRVYNWGASLSRERYILRANWSYRGESRGGQQTGRSVEPGTFAYTPRILNLELQAEYRVRKNLAVYFTGRNVLAVPEDVKNYGPSTPKHARLRERNDIGSAWTFGLKGTY
jgi:TonB-dependent receptor